jgi:hypothetical protein
VLVGALHHFPDQAAVGRRVATLLRRGGLVIAHEPTRDRITRGLAEFVHLLRVLLSAGGGFYEHVPIPVTAAERQRGAAELYHFLRCEDPEGGKTQSANDNEAGYADMHGMLSSMFDLLVEQDTYAFFHELIGGLRFSETTNAALAHYIRETDAALVQAGILPATEFFAVGRNR